MRTLDDRVSVVASRACTRRMIHRLLFIVLWIFFEALSLLNGWGGVVGYLLAPLALAALFAGLVAVITRYAEASEDGESLRSDS